MGNPEQKPDKKRPEKLLEWKEELALIPLRNIVVFPQMIVPLFIGRDKSIKALEETLAKERMVVFASQINEEIEEPKPSDISKIGTLAEIVQMMALPDGTTKILVEGIARVKIEEYTKEEPYYRVKLTRISEPDEMAVEEEALVRVIIKQFEKYVKLNKRIPQETLMSIINVENAGRLADLIASYLTLKVTEKQAILEAVTLVKRLKKLSNILEKEIEVLEVEEKLQGKVRKQIEKELPWKVKTKSKLDIKEVEKILNEDHFGLEKVKERIIEYFAVLKRTGKMGGTILCLVGPPGVGKTSIARSIARAMGRKFIRVSLGGIRDDAEIRGHRRTYVGSLPGRIIQSIHKGEVNNPVFLLDEVDKMGMDFRGDPASALLEVLDPEQNKEFSDHYLEVAFDLSDVFFITTANTTDPIPKPLRDRMEMIYMSGYTEEEKMGILIGFLLPRELEKHGLNKGSILFDEDALSTVVREYTKEAGVRELERVIATILRKIATAQVKGEKGESVHVGKSDLLEYIGAPKYRFGIVEEKDQIGAATGLVWTEVGGDTTPVEVTVMSGRGNLILTGMMGDVMQESAKAAMSFVRSRVAEFNLDENFYRKVDVHIHVPEGAVPKDGPSAGITIATALVSALTKIPVRRDVAMTGEITLRGKVLPIGGLKEKILGARRAGIAKIIIPEENRKDLDEIKDELKKMGVELNLDFVFAKEMDEVLAAALTQIPEPGKKEITPLKYPPEPPQMHA
ncbi:MAG: endopeptidase La [Candidatus Saganbacteria bacterium]|nr:endopeptidase La [Candidatus Saganbacteria bacterium]